MRRFIIAAVATLVAAVTLSAQGAQQNLVQPLPLDEAIVVGHLDNGLTYYIRHNKLPEGRAEFYLATNVGAIQEAPDQDGLAHFLEHMCFNGTENFPDKGILDYLRSIGAQFGRNINASTGFEETQYMLNNIPVERETVVDTCLMILRDYAHYVVNDPVEVDKERGVIIEERRQRRNAQWRTMERSLPYYFGDTRMAGCTLIGRQESLETFKPESLVNFYRTWYHPDMQAVVVVGDVDVARTEQKIKEIFSVIPAEPNPAEKFVPTLEYGRTEPVVGIITDPETTSPTVELSWMSPAMPEVYNNTFMGVMTSLMKRMIAMIMDERFEDITSKPDSPYLNGGFGFGDMIYENIEAANGYVALREDNILGGFADFYTELQRMIRFGFSDEEVERAKTNYLSSLESRVKSADTRKNPELVRPILQNFFDNAPVLTPEDNYTLADNILSRVNAAVLNQVATQVIGQTDLVIIYSGPDKADITPTDAQLLAVMADVNASDIQPLEGEAVAKNFLDPKSVKAGKVKKTAELAHGATKWTLRNGVNVIVLPTDYTKDQVLFEIYKDGGRSLIEDADLDSFDRNIFSMWLSNLGVSSFSGPQVTKMLSGKNLSVTPYISSLEHGVSGRSTPKDLETALQITHLYFTDPRFDDDEYNNGISQLKAYLPNLAGQPGYKFQERLYKTLYNNNPRVGQISAKTLDNASLATVEKYWRTLFADAAGATMVIVGDVDLKTLKPLVTKYIGSLPKGKKPTAWTDRHIDYVKGNVEDIFAVDMETPKSTVLQVYSAEVPYSEKVKAELDAAKYILDIRYVNSLREDEGGTYGASVMVDVSRKPKEEALIQVYFDCRPSVCDKLRSIAIDGMKDLAENGPTAEEVSMAILNLKKNIPEDRINNRHWMSVLEDIVEYSEDTDILREEAVNGLTADGIRDIVRTILASGNLTEIVMKPANTTEAE